MFGLKRRIEELEVMVADLDEKHDELKEKHNRLYISHHELRDLVYRIHPDQVPRRVRTFSRVSSGSSGGPITGEQ